MRHGVDGRKFGRNTPHRRAMLRNMANSIILDEQITTTVQKAKEARRGVDRLITIAKRAAPHAQRLAFDRSRNKEVVKKLFSELAKRYEKRAGGYTRVLRLSDSRRGDGAEMAVIELVDHPVLTRKRVKPDEKAAEKSAAAPKAPKAAKTAKKAVEAKPKTAAKKAISEKKTAKKIAKKSEK